MHDRASGGPAHIDVAVRMLFFRQFQLDLGFLVKMLLRISLRVEAQIHYPLSSLVVVYISLGTSRNLNSFN